MKKRKKSKEAKSPKSFGNLRLWGSIIIILIAVFLKFNPTALNSTLSVITGVDCDYTLMLSDLRESGAIEQDADLVMFLYRDDYYNEDSEKKNIAEVILAKHRAGSTGTVELLWLGNYTKFANIEKYRE